jgi:hypothetical protein
MGQLVTLEGFRVRPPRKYHGASRDPQRKLIWACCGKRRALTAPGRRGQIARLAKKTGPRARLKLVSVGTEKVLLLRLVPFGDAVRKLLEGRLREVVLDGKFHFDGEAYSIVGWPSIVQAWRVLVSACDPVYDPNLSPGLAELENPWPIPELPRRDPLRRPTIYMARVFHPELGEALAFQIPEHDDDFVMDFKRELSDAQAWRRYRRDLDRSPVWAVAEFYSARAHEVLDRYFTCVWDEFLAGEEWDVLEPPGGTQYPLRRLTAQEFRVLEVSPYCGIEEINLAYRERKEAYLSNRIPVEEWLDIDLAYQRIRRHHFPREQELPETVVASTAIVERLRALLPDSEDDRVEWFHGFCFALGGFPVKLAQTPEGAALVLEYLSTVPALLPGQKAG